MSTSERQAGPERREEPGGSKRYHALDPLFTLLRWIRAHVGGFYGAIGVYLAVGLGIILGAIALFAAMAALVAEGMTQRVDDSVLLWINQHASPGLDAAALEITALGSGYVIWMTVLVASVFLWSTHHPYSAALLWVAVLGGSVLNTALKASFDRPRPELFEWRIPYAGHSSFPSGHAMTAMVAYATLAYLVARLAPSRLLRRFVVLIFLVVIVGVGLSRLYLGVHYPSDVLAGFVVGFAWATFCALGIEAVRYFRDRKPEVQVEERDLNQGTDRVLEALDPGAGRSSAELP